MCVFLECHLGESLIFGEKMLERAKNESVCVIPEKRAEGLSSMWRKRKYGASFFSLTYQVLQFWGRLVYFPSPGFILHQEDKVRIRQLVIIVTANPSMSLAQSRVLVERSVQMGIIIFSVTHGW